MKTSADYQNEFMDFRSELMSFVYRLVTHQQDTEDIVQEVFIKAFKVLDKFEGKSSFKTWVFSIAANKAKDHLRSKKRWKEDYQDNCRVATYNSPALQQEMAHITSTSPQGKYEINEHIDFCFTCMSKTLLLEEQVCIMLKEMHGFKVREIMDIADLSEGKVKHALANARKRYHKIFDQRCSLINKKGVCHQCTELNGILNPTHEKEKALMTVKMVKEREKVGFDKLLDLRLALAKSIDPINSQGFELHNYMLENLPQYEKSPATS